MVACHLKYYKQPPNTTIPYPDAFSKNSDDMAPAPIFLFFIYLTEQASTCSTAAGSYVFAGWS